LLVAARQWRPVAGVLAGALVTVVLLLSLPPFLRAHERDRDGYDGWLTHVLREVPVTVVTGAESETDYLQRRIPAYGAVQHLNDVADVDDTVVVVTDPYVDLYAEPRTVPDYAVCLADAGLGRGGPDDHRAMLRTGVDYLLVEDRLRGQSVIQWQDPTFAAQYLDLLYEDGRAQLYRVRPSSLD
jgi:hypothetical protein